MFIQSNKVPADVKAHAVKYGDHSHLPPNFKEITAAKFAASKFFVYSPDFWEYRQINAYNDPKGAEKFTGSLRLAYFYDGTGIALPAIITVVATYQGFSPLRFVSIEKRLVRMSATALTLTPA